MGTRRTARTACSDAPCAAFFYLFDYIRLLTDEEDDFHQFFIDCTGAGMRPPRAMKSAHEPVLTGMIGA